MRTGLTSLMVARLVLAISAALVLLTSAAEVSIESIPDLVTKMRTASDADMEQYSLLVMKWADKDDKTRAEIAAAGVAQTLVDLVGTGSTSVKDSASRALGFLAMDETNRAAVVEADGIEALVKASVSGYAYKWVSTTLDLFGIVKAKNGIISVRNAAGEETRMKAEEVCSGVLCEILDTETKHGLKVSENPCNAG